MKTFLKPLTTQEETFYLRKCRQGDKAARDVLIERNLRLVAHIVKKYQGVDEDLDDLISIGTIGLIKAVSTYDMTKGSRLATYAARCIDNELLMMLRSRKKFSREVSLYEPIGTDKEGNEIHLLDIVEGKEQDFFNEQDRLHMADVKNLFLGGLKLRWILLGGSVLLFLILAFRKVNLGEALPRAYFQALGICGGLTVVMGVLFASDFNKYFTIFHEIFFTNDLWLFDPETDYMIRMLPEGFFYDMVMRIGACFVGGLILLAAVFFLWGKKTKNRHNA